MKTFNINIKRKKGFAAINILMAIMVAVSSLSLLGCRYTTQCTADIGQTDDGRLYTFNIGGDYRFDELLERGTLGTADCLSFLRRNVTAGKAVTPDFLAFACSAFTSRTPSGDDIMARNLDIPCAGAALVRTSPDDGYKSISITTLYLMGYKESYTLKQVQSNGAYLAAPYFPMDGINEKGVSVSLLMIENTPPTYQFTSKNNINIFCAIRMVLDYAASADEALELLEDYDIQQIGIFGYHLFIADKSGKSVVVEYPNGKMTVSDTHYVTNHYICDNDTEKTQDSLTRFGIVKDGTEKSGCVTSKKKAMSILSDAAMTGLDNYYTQWSVVYNMDRLTADICLYRNYDKVYTFTVK